MSPKDDLGFSRRDFLKTVGVGGIAAGVIAPGDAAAQATQGVGPGPVPITLTINGRTHKLEVEPRVTLLDAVRNRLHLTGVKRVCDRGSCGACTMIVDGRTIYACSALAIEMQGRNIRTIEGLADGTVLHPVQQAFCEHDALMCGYCTPGFVTATAALLEKNPNPTAEEARRALDGNVCRCGTYVRVLDAALSAPAARPARVGVAGDERAAAERERPASAPGASARPRRSVGEGVAGVVPQKREERRVRRG